MLLVFFGFSSEPTQYKSASNNLLEVNLKTGGSITIKGWEQAQVSLKHNIPLKVDETPEGLKIESRPKQGVKKSNQNIHLHIQVPKRQRLKLKTMGGNITIKGISGKIYGRTMGGNLNLSHLKGKIQMKTQGGNIQLKDSELEGELKTMGGRVVFDDVVGDVKGISMGGEVILRNVKSSSDETNGKKVKISTMGGDINVEKAIHGAEVKTMGGKIHIKDAKKFVRAKTMGGDLQVDEIDGWIKGTTLGGDIRVTMVGNPVRGKRDIILTSLSGDIHLNVPKNLSMNIEIELAYTRNSKGKYHIESDFKLKQKTSDSWEGNGKNSKKYIRGNAQIKGGKHRVILKTVNGHITIKKNKE